MVAKSLKATPQYQLINVRRSGVVYDFAGHSLGGGERVTVTEVDSVAEAAIDRGSLILRSTSEANRAQSGTSEATPASE